VRTVCMQTVGEETLRSTVSLRHFVEVNHHAPISALDAGEWSASRPCRFTPGQRTPVTAAWAAGCDPEPVWTQWRRMSAHDWNRTPIIPSIPQNNHYTD
jgi:hypothetical protein